MLFYMADTNAYPNNPFAQEAGFLASEASWANGRLTVSMPPDPGAAPQAPFVLTVDFVEDRIYGNTRV